MRAQTLLHFMLLGVETGAAQACGADGVCWRSDSPAHAGLLWLRWVREPQHVGGGTCREHLLTCLRVKVPKEIVNKSILKDFSTKSSSEALQRQQLLAGSRQLLSFWGRHG